MRTRSRNDEEKQQRREDILDAALSVFTERGFEKASMDEIAKRAKASRSLIYVYFKDKTDIHAALCVRASYLYLEILDEQLKDCKTGLERVHAGGEAYYLFYKQAPFLFKMMCMKYGMVDKPHTQLDEMTPYEIEMLELEDQLMATLVEILEEGLKDGTIDKNKVQNPLQTAMFLRGSLQGVIMLQDTTGSNLFDRAALDREELIKYAQSFIRQSVGADLKID
ncbi:MAG: TetR/AcrR family transcriptional regulator [Pseudomonadales bacterium]|nr:TetR/AcrR family transcriptional regulator [Pseudomonadales bacterium]